MSDTDFLFWIAARIVNVYGEDKNTDFVRKLCSIAAAIPAGQETPNTGSLEPWLEINGEIDGEDK